MLCCMIAALIIAHVTATVRGWLVFIGLARPLPGQTAETLYIRIGRWLHRPRVRRWIMAAVTLEIAVGSAWIGVAHGQHIYQASDRAVSALRGEQVHYIGVCDQRGNKRLVRIVIDRHGDISTRAI